MKVYFHNDLDGCASAAIVRNFVDIHGGATYQGLDYGDNMLTPEMGEGVIVLDFSFQDYIWNDLMKITDRIVWIDHHETAIEASASKPFTMKLDGLRSVDHAACVLTWKHFLPGKELPRAIELVGDRDTWSFKFGVETGNFYAGAHSHDIDPKSEFWREIFSERSGEFLKEVIEAGTRINAWKKQFYSRLREDIAFETEFDGYKTLAMNVARTGSEGFGFDGFEIGYLPSDYDIYCVFYWTGYFWRVSLYAGSAHVMKGFDVSEVAKRRGGGGHKGASGFTSEDLPSELVRKRGFLGK